MTLEKFEEKVAQFAKEQGWIKSTRNNESLFTITIFSMCKEKILEFITEGCENVRFKFVISSSDNKELFTKAFNTIKVLGTLIPKTNKKKENKEN